MREARVALPLVVALALPALAGCSVKDRTPEETARSVWEATDGHPDDFRSLYPTAAQLRALFEEKLAARFLTQIERATQALRRRPARAKVLTVKVERRRRVPPGKGLRRAAEMARVTVKLRVVGTETTDPMALVHLGKRWRALPKAALRFLR